MKLWLTKYIKIGVDSIPSNIVNMDFVVKITKCLYSNITLLFKPRWFKRLHAITMPCTRENAQIQYEQVK